MNSIFYDLTREQEAWNIQYSETDTVSDYHVTRLLAIVVSAVFKVPVTHALIHDTRGLAEEAIIRHIMVYILTVHFEWASLRVGKAFGRDRTTVGYAVRRIEDLREGDMDDILTQIEHHLDGYNALKTGIKRYIKK